MEGWIALDIDGTVTDARHSIPLAVRNYLQSLVEKKWNIVFLTGRTFSYSFSALKELDFPYFLAVQNGADILKMPEKKILFQNYLQTSVLHKLEKIYEGRSEDYLIYAGVEKGDFCYYRPQRFSLELLTYLEEIKTLSPEPWQALDSFTFSQEMRFPLIKCLGKEAEMHEVQEKLQKSKEIQVARIRDPMTQELFLNLITHQDVTKGKAIELLSRKEGPIIAAGDDQNDLSMFEVATVSIAMETAPREVLDGADLIAKSASQMGIIAALQQALLLV